jgi:dihydroorotate dehydrogenase (fumarate)
MRWTAILYGHVDCSLALTSGVHSSEDVIKAVMVGADIANVCSVLLREGIGKIDELIHGVIVWMDENEYESVEQMKGSMSHKSVAEPAAFERANYMKVLNSYK